MMISQAIGGRRFFTAFFMMIACWSATCFAAPPAGYYDSATGLSGAALKGSLHNIIKGHTVYPYSSSSSTDVYDILADVDQDTSIPGNVLLTYKGTSVAATNHSLWNREHTWPQSMGSDVSPMVSDLHHIRAEDISLNSSRNNSPYDVVASPTNTGFGNKWTGNVFEPRDAVKGDIARGILYMDVRYEASGPEADRSLVDTSLASFFFESNGQTVTAAAYGKMGKLSTLVAWANADPPDANELARNDRVYSWQGNRNPFIDHPEWVNLIYATSNNDDGVSGTITNRATATVPAGAVNYPVMTLNMQAITNEWDLGSIGLSQIGTLAPAGITAKLYNDLDNDGVVDSGEPLLASGTFSGSALTLTLSSSSRVLASSANHYLVAVNIAAASGAGTVQLRLTTLTSSPTGGTDTNYTGLTLDSSAATVSGGVTNGDSLTVTPTSLAAASLPAGSSRFPVMGLQLSASPNEWDVASLTFTRNSGAGALPDADVSSVELFQDNDASNSVTAGDTLIATSAFSSASVTLTPASPLRITSTIKRLIVVVSISGQVTNGKTLTVTLASGGVLASNSGGNDTAASFSTFSSTATTVTGGVTDGDSVTVSAANLTPLSINAGATDVALISLQLTASSNEWDVGNIGVTRSGSAAANTFTALKLYNDTNANDVVDQDDALVATTTFSGTAATLSAAGGVRVGSGTPTKLLIVADIATNAVNGATLAVSVNVNGISSHASGGSDVNPTFAGLTGSTASIVNFGSLKIAMLSTRSAAGAATAEFLVLANVTDSPINLTGWQLKKLAGTNSLNLVGTVPAKAHFLIASSGYASGSNIEGVVADQYLGGTLLGGLADGTGTAVELLDATATKVDGFSYAGDASGDTVAPTYRDGTSFAGTMTAGTSATNIVRRKRLGTGWTGDYVDTDNNVNDEELAVTKTPLNSSNLIAPAALVDSWSLY